MSKIRMGSFVPLGERHLRHLVREFVNHYRTERNLQGIGNELIERVVSLSSAEPSDPSSRVIMPRDRSS